MLSVVVPVAGITLWPFILLAKEPDDVTVRHERTHIRQQQELLILFFYVIYVGEWLWYRVKGKTAIEAYEGLRFEREAYAHEKDPEYLSGRRSFAWLKFPLLGSS
jgi:hypothetical protein